MGALRGAARLRASPHRVAIQSAARSTPRSRRAAHPTTSEPDHHRPMSVTKPKSDKPTPTGPSTEKTRSLDAAMAEIEKAYGKGAIMRLGDAVARQADQRHLDRLDRPRPGARRRGRAARARHRDLRAGELGQDDADAARHRQRAEDGRHLRLHRRRARARPGLRPQARRQPRRPAHVASPTRASRRSRSSRRSCAATRSTWSSSTRWRRSCRAPRSRARWATARRPAGAAHEPGAAQADGRDRQVEACVIFINQIREKIGVMFGNPETTTGGRALKFYASVRLDIRRIGQIKDGDGRRSATARRSRS